MRTTRGLATAMKELRDAVRRTARQQGSGTVNVAGRRNVVVTRNVGGQGRSTSASASQVAPIVQNGRNRG